MATGGAQQLRAAGTEPARDERVPNDPRRLRELRALLELRQRHLRSRIAACEELTAAMDALLAALGPGPAGGCEGS